MYFGHGFDSRLVHSQSGLNTEFEPLIFLKVLKKGLNIILFYEKRIKHKRINKGFTLHCAKPFIKIIFSLLGIVYPWEMSL